MNTKESIEILGLVGVKSFTADQLKTAYRKAAIKTHPDKGGTSREFSRVNSAYKHLLDFVGKDLSERKVPWADEQIFNANCRCTTAEEYVSYVYGSWTVFYGDPRKLPFKIVSVGTMENQSMFTLECPNCYDKFGFFPFKAKAAGIKEILCPKCGYHNERWCRP